MSTKKIPYDRTYSRPVNLTIADLDELMHCNPPPALRKYLDEQRAISIHHAARLAQRGA